MQAQQKILEGNQWPGACSACEKIDSQSREDRIRGNGNQAYADYKNNDITL
jgi:hypothetical protein